jgi:hypothetical protein
MYLTVGVDSDVTEHLPAHRDPGRQLELTRQECALNKLCGGGERACVAPQDSKCSFWSEEHAIHSPIRQRTYSIDEVLPEHRVSRLSSDLI